MEFAMGVVVGILAAPIVGMFVFERRSPKRR